MTTAEYIKKICKERKIPISRLESECGFSNGYFHNIKNGNIPSNKLYAVAMFLNVNISDLLFPDHDEDMAAVDELLTETNKDVFMIKARHDEMLIEYMMKLCSLPDDRKRFIYETIQSQYESYKKAKDQNE